MVYKDGGNSNKATVKKFNGTSWVDVGNAGFSAGSADSTSIVLDSNNTPYVVYKDGGNYSQATVKKFNGTSWVDVGTPDFSAESADFTSIALDNNNIPYVVYQDGGNDSKATVKKFDGTSWVDVGTPAFSEGSVQFTSIAFASDNTPYVVYKDLQNGFKATVKKFDGTSWVDVGTPGFSPVMAGNTSIVLDGSNTPYVVYTDLEDGTKARVEKFDGTSWVEVGIIGAASSISIAFDSNNTPYVAYSDSGNNDKATVVKFGDLQLYGTPTNANVGVHDINLTVSDGHGGTVTQNFQITVRSAVANAAMTKIAAYATDANSTVPTVQDYTDAGVSGVNTANLDAVNTIVSASTAIDVSTVAKIQTLIVSATGVAGGNHTPVIDTVFNDLKILEDALSFKVDVNVSDIDGDDLNLTVDSNNTSLIQVTQNYINILNQASYNGVTLDFNLTAQKNANGVALISLALNDGTATTTKTFKVTITPVNDVSELSQMSDVVVYKNSEDINVTLHTLDIENNAYTYSAHISDTNIISHISFDGDIMTISPVGGVSGTTDVNVTVTDSNNVTTFKVFKFIILPLEKNGNFAQQTKTTTTTADGNSTSIDLTGLSSKIITDTNGTVTHIMTIGDINTTSRSDLNGSVVAFTSTGVHTTYSDTNISIEVNATLTGQAVHELTVGGVMTKAVSEYLGASTLIGKDTNGNIEITTSVKPDATTLVSITAKADGTAQHMVEINGVKTVATSEIKGASTVIDSNANITTSLHDASKDETVSGDTWKFEAVVKTDTQGRTITVFEKKNTTTGALKDVQDTFKPSTPYDAGNKVTIGDIGGVLYFQINTSVSSDLVVE